MKARLAKICLLLPFALILLLAPQIFPQECPMAITDNSTQDIPYITLSAELFEKCLPWREGKYITIDKKGRFATLEWKKIFDKDILTTKPICNFPKQDCTPGYFSAPARTACETFFLLYTTSSALVHPQPLPSNHPFFLIRPQELAWNFPSARPPVRPRALSVPFPYSLLYSPS